MQQMTDGGCIYTLSANPGATDQRELLPAHQRLVRAVLRRGLPLLHRHATTSSPPPAPGPPPTTGASNNIGNFTRDQQLDHQQQHQRRPTATAATSSPATSTVTNGNWPSGAQTVMPRPACRAAAAQPTNVQIVGGQSGRCARRRRTPAPPTARRRSSGTATARANQRWTYTAGRQLHGVRQQVPGRLRPGHRQRHRR